MFGFLVMSFAALHDLEFSRIVSNDTYGTAKTVTLTPFDLNSFEGYTYDIQDTVIINVAGCTPGYGKFDANTRSVGLHNYTRNTGWGSRGRTTTSTVVQVNLSDAGVISTTVSRMIPTQGRGTRRGSYPSVGHMNITVTSTQTGPLENRDLTWVYTNQPDLVTRNITTGQPPDLVALDIIVKREDIDNWSYQLGSQGYDVTSRSYGGEFDVNIGSSTLVYQVRAGDETLILRGKDSVGNVLISRNGVINL